MVAHQDRRDGASGGPGVSPRRGSLVPLKTKDEVRAALETFDAYVVGVPARSAGAVLK